jgi:hypothetical protein
MNDTDPKLLSRFCVGNIYFIAFVYNASRILLVNPRQYFHHRGLACAVLTDQRMNLARLQLESAAVQRQDPWKTFLNSLHLYQKLVQFHSPPYSCCCFRLLFYSKVYSAS